MITFINPHGAVATAPREAWEQFYEDKPGFRKLTVKQAERYGELSAAVVEAERTWRDTSDADAAKALASAREALQKFVDGLMAKD